MQDEISPGTILDESFKIFTSHFLQFMAITLVIFLPLSILSTVLTSNTSDLSLRFLGLVVELIGFFIKNYLVTGAIVYGAFMEMSGKPFTIGECVDKAGSRIWTLLFASLVVGMLTLLAGLLLVIPGIIVALTYSVVVPVILVEGCSVSEAMKRSSYLTTGNRGRLFLAYLALGIFTALMAVIAGIAARAFFKDVLVDGIIDGLTTGLAGGLGSVLTTVVYYRLRVQKEDVDLESIVTVFA